MLFNRLTQTVLAVWIACSLLLVQSAGLHMHVLHEDSSESSHAHVIDVHSSSVIHESVIDTVVDHSPVAVHQAVAVDMSADSLFKYSASTLVLILFVLFIRLPNTPLMEYICRRSRQSSFTKSLTYLLQPPLRAPPVLLHNHI